MILFVIFFFAAGYAFGMQDGHKARLSLTIIDGIDKPCALN